MWTFYADSGVFEHNGRAIGRGYSGHGNGINNPALESRPDVGPIPRGDYTIGNFFDDAEKGPFVARLEPNAGTNDFGRSGFMLHGDNAAGNESASLGCIIMPHGVRELVAASNDHDLQVV